MRLAKYLSRAGVASRRQAEALIGEGRVKVDGLVVKKPQTLVTDRDRVMVDGHIVENIEPKRYLLMHKPPGYISTVKDTHNRPTVLDLISCVEARLYPVGRLDADTSGALLMTNDGEMAFRLTHPSYEIKKRYLALVSGIPNRESLDRLRKGIVIEEHYTSPAGINLIERVVKHNQALLELTLIEGKKRQVKKMCRAINHPVVKLHREEFAGLKIGGLPEGKHRFLSDQEVKWLYRLVKL